MNSVHSELPELRFLVLIGSNWPSSAALSGSKQRRAARACKFPPSRLTLNAFLSLILARVLNPNIFTLYFCGSLLLISFATGNDDLEHSGTESLKEWGAVKVFCVGGSAKDRKLEWIKLSTHEDHYSTVPYWMYCSFKCLYQLLAYYVVRASHCTCPVSISELAVTSETRLLSHRLSYLLISAQFRAQWIFTRKERVHQFILYVTRSPSKRGARERFAFCTTR